MKYSNLIKMGLSTVYARTTGKSIPLNVMISVTNRCQALCKYCNIPNRQQREMTTDELISLFDQLKSLGTQRIALWGGEPLIRDDIGYLINYAKEKCKFFVSLDTNGFLVPEKIKDIKNVDVIVLSLDGQEDIHDKNRGVGSYNKVINAIEKISGNMRIFTITVLTKENINSLDFIFNTATKYNFSTTFQILHHSKDIASNDEINYLAENSLYKEAISYIIKKKRQGYPIVSTEAYLNHILNWDDYKISTSTHEKQIKCYAARLYCNVDTDGSIYPCSGLIGSVPAKNFLDVGFKKAFEFSSKENCKSCIASCFNEYNLMHDLNFSVIYNWLRYTRKKIVNI